MIQESRSLRALAGKSLLLLSTMTIFGGWLPVSAQDNPDLVLNVGQKQKVKQANKFRPPVNTPTEEVIIFLQPGVNPRDFGARYDMQPLFALASDRNAYVFRTASVLVAQMTVTVAQTDPRVRAAYNNMKTGYKLFSFTPNDPYFFPNAPVIGFPGQWHLYNAITPGRDSNVTGAWNRNITGTGVIIGIVDEGVEYTHADLTQNYSAANSFNFGNNTADPFPTPDEFHATAVAGVAAARGGNGIGVTGAAPLANFASLRIDFNNQTAQMFADAVQYNSNVANAPIAVKNHSYGISATYVDDTLQSNSLNTSAGFGTIHTFAAGNDRGTSAQDANKKMMTANPNAIVVAAFGSNGTYSNYSNFGANVTVTAPSNSSFPYCYGIQTTDRTGVNGYNTGTFDPSNGALDLFPDVDYTSVFGGTSSASPLVAGIMALGKQAQPALNARFAKHLLAYTSRIVHATDASQESDGGWKTNGSKFHFNQNYGFGLIDADTFTNYAAQFTGITTAAFEQTALTTVGLAIPDNDPTGVSQTFSIATTAPVEDVRVYLDITHPYHGDLEAYLTSPQGTTSRLMIRSGSDGAADIKWTFDSNAFWGENPKGTWTLKVIDIALADTGNLNKFQVQVNTGRLVAVPTLLTLSPSNVAPGSPATTLDAIGTGFTPASYLTWNGTALPTTFYPPNRLRTTILAANLTVQTVAQIKVVTPDPGGTSNALNFLVGTQTNTVTNVSSANVVVGQAIYLRALLRSSPAGAKLNNEMFTFKMDGVAVGTAKTGTDGVASLPYTIPYGNGAGTRTITAEFAGDTLYKASSGTGTLTVTINTIITPANATGKAGTKVLLRGLLRDKPVGNKLAGKTLTFTIDGVQVGTGVTDATGVASVTYTIPLNTPAGTKTFKMDFASDGSYNASTANGTLTIQ